MAGIKNLKGYEPLYHKQGRFEQILRLDLSSNGNHTELRQLEDERREYIVSYLAKQPSVLKLLGLKPRLVESDPKPELQQSSVEDVLGLPIPASRTPQNTAKAKPEPNAKPEPKAESLRRYYQLGIQGYGDTEDNRDAVEVKKLLNAAVAAWTRKLMRTHQTQLSIMLPPDLAKRLDHHCAMLRVWQPTMTKNEAILHLLNLAMQQSVNVVQPHDPNLTGHF